MPVGTIKGELKSLFNDETYDIWMVYPPEEGRYHKRRIRNNYSKAKILSFFKGMKKDELKHYKITGHNSRISAEWEKKHFRPNRNEPAEPGSIKWLMQLRTAAEKSGNPEAYKKNKEYMKYFDKAGRRRKVDESAINRNPIGTINQEISSLEKNKKYDLWRVSNDVGRGHIKMVMQGRLKEPILNFLSAKNIEKNNYKITPHKSTTSAYYEKKYLRGKRKVNESMRNKKEELIRQYRFNYNNDVNGINEAAIGSGVSRYDKMVRQDRKKMYKNVIPDNRRKLTFQKPTKYVYSTTMDFVNSFDKNIGFGHKEKILDRMEKLGMLQHKWNNTRDPRLGKELIKAANAAAKFASATYEKHGNWNEYITPNKFRNESHDVNEGRPGYAAPEGADADARKSLLQATIRNVQVARKMKNHARRYARLNQGDTHSQAIENIRRIRGVASDKLKRQREKEGYEHAKMRNLVGTTGIKGSKHGNLTGAGLRKYHFNPMSKKYRGGK